MRHFLSIVLLVAVPLGVRAQDAIVPVPATIKAEGVPPIPATIADGLASYGDSRSAVVLGWHPLQRQILINTTFGSAPQIHLVAGPLRARTQVTFFRDGVSRGGGPAQFEPTTGRYFIFRKDTGSGAEKWQLFRYDVATGAIRQLTDGSARHGVPVWSRSGTLIAYDSTKRNGKDRDIYVMDPDRAGSERLVAQGEGSWSVLDWSSGDQELLALETIGSTESYLWRINAQTGAKVAVTPRGATASYRSAMFSGDQKGVYALTHCGSEFRRACRLELGTTTWRPVTGEGADADDMVLSHDRRTLAVLFNRNAVGEIALVDTSTGRQRQAPKLPVGRITDLRWHRNGTDLAFTVASIRSAGDVYSLNIKSSRIERWTQSETSGFNPDVLPEPEIVRWKSFDGREISGWMYRPSPRFTGPRPVMVNIHGGPAEAFPEPGRAGLFQGRSNYLLNELGIAIIYPNVRGSTGFGREFEQLDDGVKREDAVKDIGTLLDWIATRPDLDKNRVMATGASYGGYMTLAVATTYPDRIRCAFAGFAIANLVSFLERTEPSRQANRRTEYGNETDPATRQFLTRISPLSNAGRIKVPLFVAHGGNDPRVPAEQGAEIVQAARKNGTPVWHVVYTDEGHDLLRRTNADMNFYYWILFIQKYLLD
jgi:dipeptidyl aminopeptidase/acylaminoacyl peptidase